MKKYLKPVLLAILLGTIFGYLFFKEDEAMIKEVIDQSKLIYFIQVGVFKNYDNAVNKSKSYKTSVVIKDNNTYRVYIGLFSNQEILKTMQSLYEKNKYDYYLKKDYITNKKFLEYLEKSEKILINTNDEIVQNKLIQEILDKYKETI